MSSVRESAATAPGKRPFGLTDLSLLLMATIWAVNFSAVTYATQFLSPLALTGVRVASAAALLAPLAWFFGGSESRATRRDAISLIALGVVGNGIYQLLFLHGVARTRVGNAALIVAASPAIIALMSRAGGVERLGWRALSGVA